MQKNYNIAVIGLGHMGCAHLDDFLDYENITIHSVVDIDLKKAASVAKKYNALHYFDDYKKCINMPEVDIVIIATYTRTHLEILEYALSHKKHVLCEKPIAPSLEEGQRFVQLVKASKSKVLVGHILRHHKSYQKLKELIDNDAIGSPILVRMVQNHHIMDKKKYHSLLADASPIVDCGVHYIDIMRYFTGADVVQVDGIGTITDDDCPKGAYNYGLLTAKLSNGSIGYYEAGWGNTIASDNTKEFLGPKGRLKLMYADDRPSNKEEGDLIEYFDYKNNNYQTINVLCKRKPTGEQLEYLIKMIEEDIPAAPYIDEVYRAFEICLEADRKIRKSLNL